MRCCLFVFVYVTINKKFIFLSAGRRIGAGRVNVSQSLALADHLFCVGARWSRRRIGGVIEAS